MTLRKLGAVTLLTAMLTGTAAQASCCDGMDEPKAQPKSDMMFYANLRTGYERINEPIGNASKGAQWGFHSKLGIESALGFAFESHVGGFFPTSSKVGAHRRFDGILELNSSLGWNFGPMIDSDLTLKPMVGYAHRYGRLHGVLINLDVATRFAEDHTIGVRGGLNILFSQRAKFMRKKGYEFDASYAYALGENYSIGLDLGYRNYKQKGVRRSVHHYRMLAGFSYNG